MAQPKIKSNVVGDRTNNPNGASNANGQEDSDWSSEDDDELSYEVSSECPDLKIVIEKKKNDLDSVTDFCFVADLFRQSVG